MQDSPASPRCAHPPMHILITDPHTDGGGQVRYIQSLVRELLLRGHRVTIGCRANSILATIAADLGCECLPRFHFARGLRLKKWYEDIRTMRAFLRSSRPDVVHVNGSQDHWVAALSKCGGLGSTCLLRSRHNTYVVKDNLTNRWLNRRMTDFQICVCDMVRRDLAAHAAFDGARMVAIHNGVDAETYRPQAELRAQARNELGYGPEDVVCGIAARLVKAKGHTYLFQALAECLPQAPHAKLLILGQGALEDALRQEAKSLGIEEYVQFGGFRDHMEKWIQAFDIGVLPSIDCDTSSFSLKEQMAAEIPVLTSDYGGLTEIVEEGVEGRVVPHGTVKPLATALTDLLLDVDERRAMGKRGRQRVLREFTGAVFAERTVTAYERAREIASEHTSS